jgi:hypothetical protein
LLDNSQTSLVNLEDGSLQFLNQTLHDAEMLISVNGDDDTREFLLIFQRLGIYVDSQGRRCRAQELMFPSKPTSFAYSRPYLSLYTEYQIIIFDVVTAEWIQTLNLKRAKPLHSEGVLILCHILDAPHLVMLGNHEHSAEERLYVPQSPQQLNAKGVQKRRRKFSMKTLKDEANRGDRRSQLPISGPSDFVHVIHMGPGHVVGLQNLIELKQTNQVPSSQLNNVTGSTTSSSPSVGGHNVLPSEKMKHLINPIMRSSSSSSHAPAPTALHHNNSVQSLRNSSGRPISAQSRNSEASSLGRDNRKQSTNAPAPDPSSDYYLEPISLNKNSQQQIPNPPSHPSSAIPAAPPATLSGSCFSSTEAPSSPSSTNANRSINEDNGHASSPTNPSS